MLISHFPLSSKSLLRYTVAGLVALICALQVRVFVVHVASQLLPVLAVEGSTK